MPEARETVTGRSKQRLERRRRHTHTNCIRSTWMETAHAKVSGDPGRIGADGAEIEPESRLQPVTWGKHLLVLVNVS